MIENGPFKDYPTFMIYTLLYEKIIQHGKLQNIMNTNGAIIPDHTVSEFNECMTTLRFLNMEILNRSFLN